MTKPLHALPPLEHENLWRLERQEQVVASHLLVDSEGEAIESLCRYQREQLKTKFAQDVGGLAMHGAVLEVALTGTTPSVADHDRELAYLRQLRERLPGMEVFNSGRTDHLGAVSRQIVRAHTRLVRNDVGVINRAIASLAGAERQLYLGHRLGDQRRLARLERFAVSAAQEDGRHAVLPILRDARGKRGTLPASGWVESALYESVSRP